VFVRRSTRTPAPRFRAPAPLAFAIALLVALLAACSTGATRPTIPPDATGSVGPAASATSSVAPSEAGFPVTLSDDEGTTVVIDAEPRKIVSLTPATTEALFALGVGDRLVGKVEDFSLYPPEAASIPDVAKFGEVDVEQIVGLEADLVIAGGNSFNPPDKIAQLRSLGVPVLVLYAPDIDGVFSDLELTGAAVGRLGQAQDLVASMRAEFDQIEAATSGLDRPRVFYELDASQKIYTAADDSFVASMIELAGGDPITTGSTTDFEIALETLITADPELILLGDAAYGVTADSVISRPGWSVMTAVKNGAIRPVDDVIVTRPGPRLAEGLRALALAIHPDVVLPSAAAGASASAAP
jgi:iron complex transport system substrate-binding protein